MFKESNRLVPTLPANLKVKRKPSSQLAIAGCVLVPLLLCSCKEKDALLKEQKDLQIALNQAKTELDTYQAKINTVVPNLPAAAATLEVQLKASEKANTELTQAVNELNSKATSLQDKVNGLRPKVEAYKAKYLR